MTRSLIGVAVVALGIAAVPVGPLTGDFQETKRLLIFAKGPRRR